MRLTLPCLEGSKAACYAIHCDCHCYNQPMHSAVRPRGKSHKSWFRQLEACAAHQPPRVSPPAPPLGTRPPGASRRAPPLIPHAASARLAARKCLRIMSAIEEASQAADVAENLAKSGC